MELLAATVLIIAFWSLLKYLDCCEKAERENFNKIWPQRPLPWKKNNFIQVDLTKREDNKFGVWKDEE